MSDQFPSTAQHRLLLFFLFGQDLAPEDPNLYPNNSVGRARFGKTIIDIGAQSMQRHPSLRGTIPCARFRSRPVGQPIEFSRPGLPCAWHAKRFLSWPGGRPRAAPTGVRRFRGELGVEIGSAHLVDIDISLAMGELGNLFLKLFDFRALLADDDTRPRGVNIDFSFVGGSLNLNLGNPGVIQACLQEIVNAKIFVQ